MCVFHFAPTYRPAQTRFQQLNLQFMWLWQCAAWSGNGKRENVTNSNSQRFQFSNPEGLVSAPFHFQLLRRAAHMWCGRALIWGKKGCGGMGGWIMSTSAKITLFHNKLFSPPAVSRRRAFRCYVRFVCVPARRRLQTLLQVCAEGRRRRCRDMLQIPPSVINHMKPTTSGLRQKQKCARINWPREAHIINFI